MTDKVHITTDGGERVEAAAPVIISASRSTDIPAFYAKWFFNRLERGYCTWYNPFNGKKSYVSFGRCKAMVFWTKNPEPILPYLPRLDSRGIHYYFQFTLNDYENEGFEPNVPPLARRIETFRRLSAMIGRERVIWRFDPLIISPTTTPRELLRRIWDIGNALERCTARLVFSFVDIAAYRKVQANLAKETACFAKGNVLDAEATQAQKTEIAEGLRQIRQAWHARGWDIEMATCAEGIDLEAYGIKHNRCIDGELMQRLFGDDEELVYYLHTLKLPQRDIFGQLPPLPPVATDVKDKGQRKLCGCMASKDIGMYDTCRHLCAYCYANSSKGRVLANALKHDEWRESIID